MNEDENPLTTRDVEGEIANRSAGQLRTELEDLGAKAPEGADASVLSAQLTQHLHLIETLDRGALLDLAVWAGVDLQNNVDETLIVRHALRASTNRLDELSTRGMHALARLRGADLASNASRDRLKQALRQPESFWDTMRRRRRKLMGSLIGRALEQDASGAATAASTEGGDASAEKLKKRIQTHGVVSGLASTLRGVADDYVAEKLDEIERRIDVKLDQIDRRLEEWRDREISNRLRLLKITLIFSIVVALVSLGYDYLRSQTPPPASAPAIERIEAE